MAAIITIGERLVEMMAKNVGQRFDVPGEYDGPYPSGAPAIFIDQVAKTGGSCRIVGMVGDDLFGTLIKRRLRNDGVDVSFVGTARDKTTGIAFVTYKPDGGRDFIYTTRDSAAAELAASAIREEMFESGRWLHIMGCSIFSEEMIRVFEKAIAVAKARGMRITFDPNIRKEILNDADVRHFILQITALCDVFLPGEDELRWITGREDEREAVNSVFAHRARFVVVKRGRKGCTLYERTGEGTSMFDVAAYPAREVDPTGAGDCFAGTFISLLDQGYGAREAVAYAAASGAMAVMRKGPMEGTATLGQLRDFMRDAGDKAKREY